MSKWKDVKKVVLAYSGGLDTSIILKWLQTELGAEVVTFTADLGQGGELEPARRKAELLGIRDIRVVDVREEFVRDFVFPMFRANAQYEGLYLLGTSIARLKVIAPWRDWSFKSRTDLLDFARDHQIPVPRDKQGAAPFSVDANLLHSSSEGKVLEDPWIEPPEFVHQRTVSPMDAPDAITEITISFANGDPIALDGRPMSPANLLAALNDLGRDNGIGRLDLVENRFVGMK
ncbi:MAG: argininosuccinate synthase, partial [Rhodospirillales bacterium]|nr:argininosuccinate synthase [Rhodospirillales bacterium]